MLAVRCKNCGMSLDGEPMLMMLGFCNSECERDFAEDAVMGVCGQCGKLRDVRVPCSHYFDEGERSA